MNDQFVFVDEHVSGVYWDAKYATWDNFTGKPVDGYLANRIVGTRPLCTALENAREIAVAVFVDGCSCTGLRSTAQTRKPTLDGGRPSWMPM